MTTLAPVWLGWAGDGLGWVGWCNIIQYSVTYMVLAGTI